MALWLSRNLDQIFVHLAFGAHLIRIVQLNNLHTDGRILVVLHHLLNDRFCLFFIQFYGCGDLVQLYRFSHRKEDRLNDRLVILFIHPENSNSMPQSLTESEYHQRCVPVI